jgi:hypothetical protein
MPITERSARRHLAKRGLWLVKDRRPSPYAAPGYLITDANRWVIAGNGPVPFGLDLDDVSVFLDRQ